MLTWWDSYWNNIYLSVVHWNKLTTVGSCSISTTCAVYCIVCQKKTVLTINMTLKAEWKHAWTEHAQHNQSRYFISCRGQAYLVMGLSKLESGRRREGAWIRVKLDLPSVCDMDRRYKGGFSIFYSAAFVATVSWLSYPMEVCLMGIYPLRDVYFW